MWLPTDFSHMLPAPLSEMVDRGQFGDLVHRCRRLRVTVVVDEFSRPSVRDLYAVAEESTGASRRDSGQGALLTPGHAMGRQFLAAGMLGSERKQLI